MARLKLTIAYRGTNYHGWQTQFASSTWKGPIPPEGHGIPTVQEIVERTMAGVIGHPVSLSGSSRTDSGVHAKGQIAHFDTSRPEIPHDGLRRAINHRLPDDILIRSIESVPDNFDAVQWTTSKRYQYLIWNAEDRPLFFSDLAWHRWQPLNIEAMRQAATHLIGAHDFASFAKPGHKRESTIRTVWGIDIAWRRPKLIIGIEGNGFLWQMVRIIVGTLVEVGLERYGPDTIKPMLAAKDRRAGGPTAPAHGLYLQWIKTAPKAAFEFKSLLVPSPGAPGEG